MKVGNMEDRIAALEKPERNTEGWLVLAAIICATALQYFDLLTPVWVAFVAPVVIAYATCRTHKKTKEVIA